MLRIKLRDLTWEDRTFFYEWINDDDVIRYSISLFQKLKTNAEIDTWFRTMLDDDSSVNKGIVFNGKFVGYAGIVKLKNVHNSGEYFLFIGDKTVWGKGIGTQVTKEMITYAFEELKLHRLSLTISDINTFAVKAYKRAGFIEEGVMRDACLRDGTYHDKIMMAIINRDKSSALDNRYKTGIK
jgi:RimJ/RimL family protein N-acetyltransferase